MARASAGGDRPTPGFPPSHRGGHFARSVTRSSQSTNNLIPITHFIRFGVDLPPLPHEPDPGYPLAIRPRPQPPPRLASARRGRKSPHPCAPNGWTPPSEDRLLADSNPPQRRRRPQDGAAPVAAHLAHIALRDLGGLAPSPKWSRGMTMLADVTTNYALDFHHRQLAAQFGEPSTARGRPQRLLVVGMGKLGRELNVSSDVDYIFVHPKAATAGPKKRQSRFLLPPGQTPDRRPRRTHRRRPGLPRGHAAAPERRLRPWSAPSTPWKTTSSPRAANGSATFGSSRGDEHRRQRTPEWPWRRCAISRPFVFRANTRISGHQRHARPARAIRREVARKDMADHVKLGPGGIREIEFIAQVFQLIRGGRDPALQVRPTLSGAALLVERRIVSDRPKASCGKPTSPAPPRTPPAIRRRQADPHAAGEGGPATGDVLPPPSVSPTGRACSPNSATTGTPPCHFFSGLFRPGGRRPRLTGLGWHGQSDTDAAQEQLGEPGFRHPKAALDRLAELRASTRYQQLAAPTGNASTPSAPA